MDGLPESIKSESLTHANYWFIYVQKLSLNPPAIQVEKKKIIIFI